MGKESPPTTSARPRAVRERGQLWQVPLFLLGLLAVAAVWHYRPWLRAANARHWRKDLSAARTILETHDTNLTRALELTQNVLARTDGVTPPAGEAVFLVGSVYLAQADGLTGAAADEARHEAREYLERAAALEIPGTDRARLQYRLGKCWFHLGVDPVRVLTALGPVVELDSDDKAEGYGMICLSFLRLPTPNVRDALVANERQLSLATGSENALAPARLLRGELLLKTGQSDEARRVLARIRPGTEADLYPRARLLRAQSCQQDKLWAEAAPLWEENLKDPAHPPEQAGRIWYSLGLCYRRVNRLREAADAWQKALSADTEAARAAAFGLAEVSVLGSNPAEGVTYLERALQDISRPADYHNSLVDLKEAANVLEFTFRTYTQKEDYARARQTAVLAERLATANASRELVAQTEDAWALDYRKKADMRVKTDPRHAEARVHFRKAAETYLALADEAVLRADKAKWLWFAADRMILAQELAASVPLLGRFLETETVPERRGEGWFVLAEVQRELGRSAAARAAYLKCIEEFAGPFALRARYQLALADIDEGNAKKDPAKLDDAEATLKQILALQVSPDDETYENALFLLADLLFQRGKHSLAASRYRFALEQYPSHPRSVVVRYRLAECNLRLAAVESESYKKSPPINPDNERIYRQQYRNYLETAVRHFQKLADDLSAQRKASSINEMEDAVLRRSEAAVAECHFLLGNYPGAIQSYEQIVLRHPHEGDALIALKEIYRCNWALRDTPNARLTLDRIKLLLPTLPKSAFQSRPGILSLEEEQEWVRKALEGERGVSAP